MAIESHLAELEKRHEALEDQISEALSHPSTDDLQLLELKRRKLHVKDEIAAASPTSSQVTSQATSQTGQEKYESTILGEGIVNTRQVCDLGKKSGGTHYYIIEQEAYQGKDPLDCSKADLDIMKKWGYR